MRPRTQGANAGLRKLDGTAVPGALGGVLVGVARKARSSPVCVLTACPTISPASLIQLPNTRRSGDSAETSSFRSFITPFSQRKARHSNSALQDAPVIWRLLLI